MIWNIRKEKAFNQNSRKKTEFQKMRIDLGTSGTTLNIQHLNHVVPEGEEEEQEIENLFEKIMKENFPNLVKEIDRQVQEAQRVPNKLDPKKTTPRHIIIKMLKVKKIKIES